METQDLIRTIFPRIVADNFELIKIEENAKAERIDVWLDEKPLLPDDERNKWESKGFTEEKVVQDFPIRGNAVFLHLRRRKWLNKVSGSISVRSYDLSEMGTQLAKGFVSFLKEVYRFRDAQCEGNRSTVQG